VLWQSKLQTKTALFMMEAKIIALSGCCRELLTIIIMVCLLAKGHQSFDWKYDHECLHSYEDNSGALVLAKTLPPQFLLEANIAQSRLFDFAQRFSSTIFNYSTSTLSNNLRHLYKRSSHPSCF